MIDRTAKLRRDVARTKRAARSRKHLAYWRKRREEEEMSTPPHLKPLNQLLVLSLNQQGRKVVDLIQTMMTEKQAFLLSGTPWDAGRVAKLLRHVEQEAGAAALAFEAAAKAKDVDDGK